jgi:membrane protease YdiL (CAAX protease family)
VKLRTPFSRIVRARSSGLAGGPEPAAQLGSALVIGALAFVNLAKHRLAPGDVSFSAAAALALLLLARRSGLSWEQLGLGRGQLRSGGTWALAAVLSVAGAYVAGVLTPRTRSAFLDSRYQQDLPHALVTALVVIPIGTVLLEEVGFRSVLWATLHRQSTPAGAMALSSVLFGLWHVLPSLDFTAAHAATGERDEAGTRQKAMVALGTVAFTALGGLVAGEMRRRSGSLLASAGMHWATNGLGVLFGVAAWRFERRRAGAVELAL